MKDSDSDYSDIPPLGDEFFKKATVARPPVKQQLTIRLEADVLNWLKANGRGYQTRINRILRTAMESTPRAARGPQQHQRRKSSNGLLTVNYRLWTLDVGSEAPGLFTTKYLTRTIP